MTAQPNNRKNEQATQFERRAVVAEMYLQGSTQQQIATRVGVTQACVCKDLKVIFSQWKQSAVADYGDKLAVELARLHRLEAKAWRAFETSKEGTTTTIERSISIPHSKKRCKHRHMDDAARLEADLQQLIKETRHTTCCGDPRFLVIVHRCIELRLKLLGALKPNSVNVSQTVQLDWKSLLVNMNQPQEGE